MIKIPRCFYCDHFCGYDESTDSQRCKAFPEGIPEEVFLRAAYSKEECAIGYRYKGAFEKYM